jgi:manganese transport protein
MSQVVLSFGIPFALVPLVLLTSNKAIIGAHINTRLTSSLAWSIASVIVTSLSGTLISRRKRSSRFFEPRV